MLKEIRTKTVWYVLWGLVPLGDNTTSELIGAKEKVSVSTQMSFLDCVVSYFLGIVSIQSRTIEVKVY